MPAQVAPRKPALGLCLTRMGGFGRRLHFTRKKGPFRGTVPLEDRRGLHSLGVVPARGEFQQPRHIPAEDEVLLALRDVKSANPAYVPCQVVLPVR